MDNAVILICGKLFDGVHDELHEDMEILVEGNAIHEVGKNLSRPAGAQVIDLSHLTVTPGLIDAHIHSDVLDWRLLGRSMPSDSMSTLAHLHTAQRTLERGFTTIRCHSAQPHDYGVVDVKRLINQGVFAGSRMVVAAHLLGSNGSHGDATQFLAANPKLAESALGPSIGCGPVGFREIVRREVKYGSDFIKIILSGGFATPNDSPLDQQLEDDELEAIISTAHALGKTVTAHVYHPPLMQKLLRYGIDGMEHGAMMDEETAEMFEKSNTYLVPTFCPYDEIIRMDEANLAKKSPEFRAKLRQYSELLKRGREVIINSNIRLGYGTDFVAVHQCYESWWEYDSWMKSGMDPFRALRAATSVNAGILGLGNYVGVIEPGKLADISGWHKDLLTESDALSQCDFVMKNGKVFEARYSEG